MMTDEAIALVKNKKACILKADTCDRDCSKCELVKKTEVLLSAYDAAIKTLEQTKWIPCSKRLPEDRREVLVTAYWHETYQVMMASYFGDGLWWCVPFNNSGEPMQRLKPKAWMPLPEPYRVRSEKQNDND